MRTFDEIYAIAADRHPDLEKRLKEGAKPKTPAALARIPDDRWLAQMTRNVFNAGFNWKVVDNMWPGFEAAFEGFDIGRCAMLHDEDFERLASDTRIVRYGAKIRSVQQNALFISELREEHGSAGKAIGGWPKEDYVGLLAMLKKRGSRLGGNTGQYVLRFSGVDSFILSMDVRKRLESEGLKVGGTPSQKAMQDIQTAFNAWRTESGRTLTEISRVLALSI